MDKVHRLREIVAPLAGVAAVELTPASRLGGRLRTSIGRATLESVLRREFGKNSSAAIRAETFGDLHDAIFHDNSTPSETQSLPSAMTTVNTPMLSAGFACGVDMECVSNLPASSDFWETEFYRVNFTPEELAYCIRQEDPRQHFAARWCAKEALRKCDPQFLNQRTDQIEVVRAESGAVSLSSTVAGQRTHLPHALSLSHTADMAVAVVISMPAPVQEVHEAPPGPEIVGTLRRDILSVASMILALASLALALWILIFH